MDFREFSKQLIQTGDLDPDYILMKEMEKEYQLSKIIMLKWIHLKIFVYDSASEWRILMGNEDFETCHYGAERRKNKRNTERQYNAFVAGFSLADMPKDYPGARKYLMQFSGIGDWAAWKFCDLLERVLDVPIDFTNVDFRTAYHYPLKGLCRVNRESDDFVPKLSDDLMYNVFMYGAQKQMDLSLLSPPKYDRPINIQEIETCLCKYHSFLGKHYKIGQDTLHLAHRLRIEGIEITPKLHAMEQKFLANPLGL